MYLSFSVSVIISSSIHVGEMAIFYSFSWSSRIALYICTTTSYPLSIFGHLGCFHVLTGASLVAQMAKNLPVMQETWV